MNDYKMDITGLQGVMKQKGFFKPNATEKDRTFTILSGPGCSPEVNTRRQIRVKWNDGATDTLSSYDIEVLITKDGKRLKQVEPVFTEYDRAAAPGDIKPPQDDETKPRSDDKKPRTVRRKA